MKIVFKNYRKLCEQIIKVFRDLTLAKKITENPSYDYNDYLFIHGQLSWAIMGSDEV